METSEKMLFSNLFGAVTDKRIIINYKKGTEDLPIRQITSVSYQNKRNYVFSIVNFLGAFVGLFALWANIDNMNGVIILVFLLLIVFGFLTGIANWIGHHNILISTGGRDRKPIKVEMAKTREGREFVDAVKRFAIK